MRQKIFALTLTLAMLLGLASCVDGRTKKPEVLTLWHNFGGQMQSTMDELVDEFNNTVGKEEGIILSVTSISGSKDLQEKLGMIAHGDPGAPAMPDITTAYPASAAELRDAGLLASLDNDFSEEELEGYLPQFLAEGRLDDGKLYVFPFAKSTEVLYVNQTLFDRFSAATGASIESLATFEGIARTAMTYYAWTDGLTPEIPDDGSAFFTVDSLFNLAQVGMEQLGQSVFSQEELNLSTTEYRRIWESLFEPAVRGGYAVHDGYSSDLSKTGAIVCSAGSTAGILFYGDEVTYPDNRKEAVSYTVLPYPVFEGGKKVAIQRGSGLCVAASTPERERCAAVFLKWFTAPEQNIRFVSSTGYLPVMRTAFERVMSQEMETNENQNIKKLLKTAVQIFQNYKFYMPPVFPAFSDISSSYEKDWKMAAIDAKSRYRAGEDSKKLSEEYFIQFTTGR